MYMYVCIYLHILYDMINLYIYIYVNLYRNEYKHIIHISLMNRPDHIHIRTLLNAELFAYSGF